MRVLKQLVKNGPVFGAEIVGTSPVIVENYANYSFDYVNINLAHSELDLGACAEFFTTCRLWDIAAAVTVSHLNEAEIRKAFGMGAQAVIVPGVQTKDDMLRIIGAAKFPGFPGGKRSYSRAVKEAHYGGADYSAGKYLATCAAVEMVIPMCDSVAFFDNIDGILGVQGIDAVAFNPVDYALSIGAGDFDTIDYERKDLADALQVLAGKCKAAGVEVLLPVWPATYEKARKLADCGVRMLEIGSDTRDFAAAANKVKTEKLAPLLAEFDKAETNDRGCVS